jgi:hypothetical protein
MTCPVLAPPAHQQRAADIMTPDGFGQTPALAKAFFYNANLLSIRPAPTATGIGDRKDLSFGSVSMVGHSAETYTEPVKSKRRPPAQAYGGNAKSCGQPGEYSPRRMATDKLACSDRYWFYHDFMRGYFGKRSPTPQKLTAGKGASRCIALFDYVDGAPALKDLIR